MPDIRITISADSKEAIDSIRRLGESSDYTATSLTKLGNELVKQTSAAGKEGASAESLARAQGQYLNALDRTLESYKLTGSAAEAYRRQLALLDRQMQKIATLAPASPVVEEIGTRKAGASASLLDEQRKETAARKEAAAAVAELAAKNRELSESMEHLKAVALNDKVKLMKEQYQALDKELEKAIRTTGVGSRETEKLAKEMNNLKAAMDRAGKTDLATRMKNLVKSFVSAQVVVYLLQKSFQTVTRLFRGMAEEAAAAEETANLFNTTFENISVSANNVAAAFSGQLGLAVSTAQQAIGLFGDLAMGYKATQAEALEFAETAARTTLDIISFKNISGDTTEIMQAFASGLAGNYENFRKYGYIVTAAEVKTRLMQKGLDKLTGSALQFAKIQETLNIVVEKSANAAGDMEKTLNSTANLTRRVQEANKQLLSTMGEGLNKVLNPLKEIWLDIVDSINKAALAQKLFEEGQRDIDVFDVETNEGDRLDLARAVGDLQMQYTELGKGGLDEAEWQILFDRSYEMLSEFGAEAEGLVNSFGVPLEGVLKDIAIQADAQLRIDKELEKAEKERAKQLESMTSAAQSFYNALSSITGVVITRTTAGAPEAVADQRELDAYAATVAADLMKAVSEAASSLRGSSWESFVSPVELALGIAEEESGLETKLKEVASLYETVYNQHLKDGELTEIERAQLEDIAELYSEINDRIEAITAEKKRQEDLGDAIAAMEKEAASYEEKRSDEIARYAAIYSGLPENIQSLQNERGAAIEGYSRDKQAALALASGDAERSLIEEKYAALIEKANEYYDLAISNAEEENSLNISEAIASAMDATAALGGSVSPRFSSIESAQSIGEDLFENLQAVIEEMRDTLIENGAAEAEISRAVLDVQERGMEAIERAVTEEEERQKRMVNGYDTGGEAMLASLGEIGELVSAFQMLSTTGSGLLGILIDLVSQTEAVQEICSFLTDSILPVLNAFLEPLLPVIQTLSSLFQNLFVAVLAPAFPILKGVAMLLAFVFGLINTVVSFIADGVKWIAGTIMKGLVNLVNGVIDLLNKIPFVNIKKVDNSKWTEWADTDVFGNAEKNWQDTLNTLDEIAALNMEIADNTSDSPDLSVYNDMLSKGLLTASEYAAMISEATGKNYDNVLTFGDGAYWSGGGGSTNISQDNISIVINGSDKDAKEIAEEVIRELNERQRGGGQRYA